MIFDPNFSDFIKLLNQYNAKYVLVGGMAVLIHGHFRTTKDMDIFYEAADENIDKILKVINEFGFGYLRLTKEDLSDVRGYIKLGTEPVRIDLFCDLPGVNFTEVYEAAFDYVENDLTVKVIHVNHLIQNKRNVGRLVDLDDVQKLEKIIKKKKL